MLGIRRMGPCEAEASRLAHYCERRLAQAADDPAAIAHWRHRLEWWRRTALYFRLTEVSHD